MDMNACIMIIWPIAAMEAKAAGWDEIEPFHLLCAALKFAELDSENLDQLAKASGDKEQVLNSHKRLIDTLSQQWAIEVPETSTSLRRSLRRGGKGNKNPKSEILHRSVASREAFSKAQQFADTAGRDTVEVPDLVNAIFAQQEEWIVRAMKKLDLPCEGLDQNSAENLTEKWGDILQQITPEDSLSEDNKYRIQSDPVVKVLADLFANNKSDVAQPCLLVTCGQRHGQDILQDLVQFQSSIKMSTISVFSVHNRCFLEKISSNDDSSATSLLQLMIDQSKFKRVFFFGAMHRYLSIALTGEVFAKHFHNWLRKTDGRFLFEIPEKQYYDLIENQPGWKGVFRIVWIHDRSRDNDFEL